MTRVANGQAPARREEGGYDRRCEGPVPRQRGELLVEHPHEFRLVQAVHEPPHERTQFDRCRGHWVAMSRHIREQQAADSPCGAARSIINVSAVFRLSERFAVYPRIQAAKRNRARGELAPTPDFHALHMLFRLPAHATIIPAQGAGSNEMR